MVGNSSQIHAHKAIEVSQQKCAKGLPLFTISGADVQVKRR